VPFDGALGLRGGPRFGGGRGRAGAALCQVLFPALLVVVARGAVGEVMRLFHLEEVERGAQFSRKWGSCRYVAEFVRDCLPDAVEGDEVDFAARLCDYLADAARSLANEIREED